MAHPQQRQKARPVEKPAKPGVTRRILRAFARVYIKSLLLFVVIVFCWVVLYRFVNPPITWLMYSEYERLHRLEYQWVDLEDMSQNIPLAIVAAEDANFCLHNGFDYDAIAAALDDGATRGASTISQQVAKNVFLWPGRSWIRKGLEAGLTVFIETLWPKDRILEVYLNVAQFGPATFGVDAAARKYFNTDPRNLRLADAAKLAVTLPSPLKRTPNALPRDLRRRASRIASGGATIRRDGRAACFLPPTQP